VHAAGGWLHVERSKRRQQHRDELAHTYAPGSYRTCAVGAVLTGARVSRGGRLGTTTNGRVGTPTDGRLGTPTDGRVGSTASGRVGTLTGGSAGASAGAWPGMLLGAAPTVTSAHGSRRAEYMNCEAVAAVAVSCNCQPPVRCKSTAAGGSGETPSPTWVGRHAGPLGCHNQRHDRHHWQRQWRLLCRRRCSLCAVDSAAAQQVGPAVGVLERAACQRLAYAQLGLGQVGCGAGLQGRAEHGSNVWAGSSQRSLAAGQFKFYSRNVCSKCQHRGKPEMCPPTCSIRRRRWSANTGLSLLQAGAQTGGDAGEVGWGCRGAQNKVGWRPSQSPAGGRHSLETEKARAFGGGTSPQHLDVGCLVLLLLAALLGGQALRRLPGPWQHAEGACSGICGAGVGKWHWLV
jgi:hypothetical protein